MLQYTWMVRQTITTFSDFLKFWFVRLHVIKPEIANSTDEMVVQEGTGL